MTSLPTSQPILSSSCSLHTLHSLPSRPPEPTPNTPMITGFVSAERHSYRSLMLLQMLGGEQRHFQQTALFTTEIETLARCDFILLDTFNMTLNEAQEAVTQIRSATLAPLVVLVIGDFVWEEALLRAGADTAISFSESLEVSLALCKATIRRARRSYHPSPNSLEWQIPSAEENAGILSIIATLV